MNCRLPERSTLRCQKATRKARPSGPVVTKKPKAKVAGAGQSQSPASKPPRKEECQASPSPHRRKPGFSIPKKTLKTPSQRRKPRARHAEPTTCHRQDDPKIGHFSLAMSHSPSLQMTNDKSSLVSSAHPAESNPQAICHPTAPPEKSPTSRKSLKSRARISLPPGTTMTECRRRLSEAWARRRPATTATGS